jgi:hypothetical protein
VKENQDQEDFIDDAERMMRNAEEAEAANEDDNDQESYSEEVEV